MIVECNTIMEITRWLRFLGVTFYVNQLAQSALRLSFPHFCSGEYWNDIIKFSNEITKTQIIFLFYWNWIFLLKKISNSFVRWTDVWMNRGARRVLTRLKKEKLLFFFFVINTDFNKSLAFDEYVELVATWTKVFNKMRLILSLPFEYILQIGFLRISQKLYRTCLFRMNTFQ